MRERRSGSRDAAGNGRGRRGRPPEEAAEEAPEEARSRRRRRRRPEVRFRLGAHPSPSKPHSRSDARRAASIVARHAAAAAAAATTRAEAREGAHLPMSGAASRRPGTSARRARDNLPVGRPRRRTWTLARTSRCTANEPPILSPALRGVPRRTHARVRHHGNGRGEPRGEPRSGGGERRRRRRDGRVASRAVDGGSGNDGRGDGGAGGGGGAARRVGAVRGRGCGAPGADGGWRDAREPGRACSAPPCARLLPLDPMFPIIDDVGGDEEGLSAEEEDADVLEKYADVRPLDEEEEDEE